jgi:spore maturation protein SpmB
MDTAATFKRGFFNGLALAAEMVKVIVPFYLLVELLRYLGVITLIGRACGPVMGLFGLPGESALALIAGYTANMYAALAVLTPLHLSCRDVTTIALMLGISHSLPVETSVTRKTGVNAWFLLVLRVVLSLVVGVLLNLIWNLF